MSEQHWSEQSRFPSGRHVLVLCRWHGGGDLFVLLPSSETRASCCLFSQATAESQERKLTAGHLGTTWSDKLNIRSQLLLFFTRYNWPKNILITTTVAEKSERCVLWMWKLLSMFYNRMQLISSTCVSHTFLFVCLVLLIYCAKKSLQKATRCLDLVSLSAEYSEYCSRSSSETSPLLLGFFFLMMIK